MKKQITTLEDLHREQRKLELQMEVTKREFAHSLGTTRNQLKDFLLNKVALPVGVAGLAAVSIKKMTASNDGEAKKVVVQKSSNGNFEQIVKYFTPLLLSAIKDYFVIKKVDEKTESEPSAPVRPVRQPVPPRHQPVV